MLFTSARGGNFDIYMLPKGGPPSRLTAHPAIDQSADWHPDRLSYTIAFMSKRDGDYEIFTMLINGRRLRQLTYNTDRDGFPRWSPDASRILFTSFRDGNLELYVMNADGTDQMRLTRDSRDDIGGAWSPDGMRIAFVAGDHEDREIYLMQPDGSDLMQLTNNAIFEGTRIAWSPDGSRLAYHAYRDVFDDNADIYVISVDGTNETRLTRHRAKDRWPVWSPDRQKIGFTSDRDGDDEVYVMNADGSGLVRLTNSLGPDILDAWRCS